MDFSKINLEDHQELAREIVLKTVNKPFRDRNEFQKFRNKIIKSRKGEIFHNLYFIKAYNDLVKEGKIEESSEFLKIIQKRSVRTMSGVSPLTVMTKPFPCPGKCIYCPTDVRMPKSYIPSQPAAQRGFRQRFDPYSQVFARLKAMKTTGHPISKIELRVLGGTWSAYPKQYQTWFLKRCLQALNEFSAGARPWAIACDDGGGVEAEKRGRLKRQRVDNPYGEDVDVSTLVVKSVAQRALTWDEVVKENETADVKCIGINIETRPDHIDKAEVRRLRRLGVTKVEMGVQTTDDRVQEITKRGHDLESVRQATKLLKDAGFKIGYHMMPNLPGSTIELDKRMIDELFTGDEYQPDYLKIYPCVVMPRTALASIYRKGEFEPYDDETLEEVLLAQLRSVPEWCRIDRLARDIPADEIEAGFKVSNIRQILEKKLAKEGTPSRDIRSREIRDQEFSEKDVELIVREYDAGGGKELFLSYEDVKQDKLISLLRLRFPKETFISELKDAALIREVHVYGKQVAVGKKGSKKQHVGWGTKLLRDAERIAEDAGFQKMAIIAGIGTREYYRKKGYKLEGTYMVVNLRQH